MISGIVKEWKSSNKLERLWLLAKIEFKLRYYESKLGLLWALLKPLLDILIYYIAFKVIMDQKVEYFTSYLFIGLIIWNFFVESTTGTVQILWMKKYLYEYSNMNKMEIYVSTLLSNAIGFFFNFLMFLVLYDLVQTRGGGISLYNLWIFPLFADVFILSLALSLTLSTLYIIAKDIHQIWQVFTSILLFLSPIFYAQDTFEHRLPYFKFVNPLAGVIVNARRVLMYKQPPDYHMLAIDMGYALLLLWLGVFLLNKLGAQASEKL
jgi:ABC-type polysaccharide/polyol phosphate export permease